jgi:hypothetical protein
MAVSFAPSFLKVQYFPDILLGFYKYNRRRRNQLQEFIRHN